MRENKPDFANKVDQFENFYLDGANFEADMMNAIDNLPLTDNLAAKFLKGIDNPTSKMLKKHIKDNFDNVFKLSN